jgi:hypothetical protein
MARKRDMKGSYKAKLSLEKLILEHERKKLHLSMLVEKQDKIREDLVDMGSDFVATFAKPGQDCVPQNGPSLPNGAPEPLEKN